jgi:hypothetical protein
VHKTRLAFAKCSWHSDNSSKRSHPSSYLHQHRLPHATIMAPKHVLLRNGTFLIHDAKNHVVPTATSVLIEDGKISNIAQDIEASNGVEVIDCTDKIISPGFVDTHHHGWQTQLKGRHANEQLLPYIVTGRPRLRTIKQRLIACRSGSIRPIHARGLFLQPACCDA